jgi:hypothetical protein
MLKFIGALLIVAGIFGFGWGVLHGGMRITRTDQTTTTETGSAVQNKVQSLPLAPIASGICIVAGVIVLAISGKPARSVG